jgi:hypothetical protein
VFNVVNLLVSHRCGFLVFYFDSGLLLQCKPLTLDLLVDSRLRQRLLTVNLPH